MNLAEGLLFVVVIMLTIMVVRKHAVKTQSRTWDCVDRESGETASVRITKAKEEAQSADKVALAENMEYFEKGVDKCHEAELCGDGELNFAINEFGAPGMEYKDYVTSQAVDPAVIQNHQEYIYDRIGNKGQFITGPTMSPDSHESYDPIPWVGLRRPEAVKQFNPTQVPDIDLSLYEKRPKFTWVSSS